MAGEQAYEVRELQAKGNYISGHVLLNQCGSLLTRRNHRIQGYSRQKNFLQRIAATSVGVSHPLLYMEASLFPSLFWLEVKDGAMAGALPSCIYTGEDFVME